MGKDTAGPELPDGLAYLWHWFIELNQARTNGFSANPITFPDLDAWARLTKSNPTPRDIRTLKKIDMVFLEVNAPAKD